MSNTSLISLWIFLGIYTHDHRLNINTNTKTHSLKLNKMQTKKHKKALKNGKREKTIAVNMAHQIRDGDETSENRKERRAARKREREQ